MSDLDICTECGATVGDAYHPYAFCVLVKAGFSRPESVIELAAIFYDKNGWPESGHTEGDTDGR